MADERSEQLSRGQLSRRHFIRIFSASFSVAVLQGCLSSSEGASTGSTSSTTGAGTTAGTPGSGATSGGSTGTSGSTPPAAGTPVQGLPLPRTATLDITISSAADQSLAPFCVGQAFRQGDIPAGQGVVASVPNVQAVIKNRWPDGSAKFAIVSGRANVTAASPLKITLAAGSPAGSSPLTEQDLSATGVAATTQFSSAGSVDLAALIGVASAYNAGVRRWSAGRVIQWVSGPEMSSWIYYSPIGSDPHLSAWFEVRLWRGGHVEVLPWIENGNLNTAGPTSKSGTATFTLGGSQRYSGSLNLAHHTRAVLSSGSTFSHWLGTNPQVLARPNPGYLQVSRLVPDYYGNTSASSPLFSALSTTYTPLGQADYPNSMGTAGYHASIGLLPQWDVAYLSSAGDPRAWSAVIVNAYSAGRYGIHYRDETTNRPFRFSDHPDLCVNDANSGLPHNGTSATGTYTPAPGGSAPPNWTTTHHPSIGFMAYMLTGRWYFMEQVQFSAVTGYLKQNSDTRERAKGILRTNAGANTTRGAAWSLRTLAQAACVTPDDDTALRTDLINSVEENINFHHARYVARPNHPQGVCTPYSDYTAGDNKFHHSIWMEDFLTAVWGYAIDLGIGVSAAGRQRLSEFFAWKSRSIVGRLGGSGANEYGYQDAAQYTISVAPSDGADWSSGVGPWYGDWGQIYQATLGQTNGPSGNTELRGAYYPDPTSYWGNLQPAIAYAASLNAPGAVAAYQRMASASNWGAIVAQWNDDPVWGVRPRA